MADILVVGITFITKNFCSILPSHNLLMHSFLVQEKRELGTDGRKFLPSNLISSTPWPDQAAYQGQAYVATSLFPKYLYCGHRKQKKRIATYLSVFSWRKPISGSTPIC